jgi:hypothetical protein
MRLQAAANSECGCYFEDNTASNIKAFKEYNK